MYPPSPSSPHDTATQTFQYLTKGSYFEDISRGTQANLIRFHYPTPKINSKISENTYVLNYHRKILNAHKIISLELLLEKSIKQKHNTQERKRNAHRINHEKRFKHTRIYFHVHTLRSRPPEEDVEVCDLPSLSLVTPNWE